MAMAQRVCAAVLIAAVALSAAPAAALAPGCTDGTLCFDTDMPTAPLQCYPGYYCPGNQSAQLCPAGKYCLTSVDLETCPEGYYCPPNTVEPKACSPFASCPEGSDRYFLWGGVLLAVAPFLLILVYKYAVVRRSLVGQQPTEVEADGKAGRGLRRAGSVADGGLALNGAPLSSPVVTPDTLAPFSDTGMTMRMLARMSVADRAAPANGNDDPNDDEVAGPNGHGGVAVPMGGVANAAQRSLAVQPVNLRFDKLVSAVTVDGKPKTIMQSVSGTFRAGRVAAVMGPSGAGKTTLFRILMGKLPVTGGGVLLNDEPADLRQLQGRTGFVPQADVMLTTLTVRDVLVHAARTRLPRDLPDHKKLERVDEIMKALSLTHIQHSIIGDAEAGQRGISGGERKRVSIGIELVANPSVLLLDEPTTGLDSTTSLDVVQLLKTIAKTQRVTVVAVLHQPRNLIFELFDDLLLLAPGGRTVYSGSSSRALNYFAAQGFPCPPKGNPADHFIDVISGANINADPKKEAAAHAAAAAGAVANDGEPQTAAELQVKLVAAWQVEEQKGTYNRSSARGAASGVASGAVTPHGAAVPPTPAGSATPSKAHPKAVEGAGWFEQVWLNLRRGVLQQVRGQALNTLLLEMSFHLFAGIVIGISFVDKNWFIPPLPPGYAAYCPEAIRDQCQNEPNRDFLQLQATFITMALGLIAAVTGVRTLGSEIMNTSREVAAGSSLTAYFVGKVLCDLPMIVMYSLVFTSTFFVMAAPNSHFDQFFLVMVLFEFVMYSLGYVCSVLFQAQENALIMAVVASLLAGLATDNDGPEKSVAWSRWSSEALFLTEIRADSLTGVTRDLFQAYVDNVNFFSLTNFNNDLLALIIFGIVMRLMSLWLLRRRQRLIEASS